MCRSKSDGGRRCSGGGSGGTGHLALTQSEIEKLNNTPGDELGSLARRDHTSPAVLAFLAEHPDKFISSPVSANPSTPTAVLSRLANGEVGIRRNVAGNPSTPPAVLSRLAIGDEDREVRKTATGNPSTSPETLTRLAEEYDLRETVASNPSTSPETLTRLSESTVEYVRRDVASNPSTPPAVLSSLADDEREYVRRELTGNISTPPSVLVKLTKDESSEVKRYATESSAYKGLRTGITEDLQIDPSLPDEWRDQLIDTELDRRFGNS